MGVPFPAIASKSYNTFNFHGAVCTPAYRLHWAWIKLDYISCLLLLIASI